MHIGRSIASVGLASVARASVARACAALALSGLAALAGCGSAQKPPEPAAAPQPTVFDDLTSKQKELPAAVEASQQQHMDDVRRQVDEAEGAAPAPESGTPR